MNTEKYIVRLSGEERQKLETIVKKLKGTSQTVKRAIVLLKADTNGPNWTNEKIHELTGVALKTISNIRKQLVTEGFDVVLDRKNVACHLFRKNSTGYRKQNSWQHVAGRHRKALVNGRFDSSLIKLIKELSNNKFPGIFFSVE